VPWRRGESAVSAPLCVRERERVTRMALVTVAVRHKSTQG
jgi:hypothetical protein